MYRTLDFRSEFVWLTRGAARLPSKDLRHYVRPTLEREGRMLRTLFLGVWSLLIIGINLIPLGVVWYVLERVTDRTEVLIVTLAGMLYAMINSAGSGNNAEIRELKQEVAEARTEMRRLLDPKGKERAIDEVEARERRNSKEFHRAAWNLVPALVSMVVFIWCLVRFFAVI